MKSEERREAVTLALEILKKTLVETETSMAIYGENLVFFGTEEYLEKQDVKQCDAFAVSIRDLVK